MAKFRILWAKFWADPKVQELADTERVDEIAVISYAITGILAARDENISGIYETSRANFKNHGLNLARTTAALEYINQHTSSVMRYDFDTHIVFLPNFFIYQTQYKPSVKVIPSLLSGHKETGEKAPEFWREFSRKYKKNLHELAGKLANIKEDNFRKGATRENQLEFLEKLINLYDSPSSSPKNPKNEKLFLNSYQI